MAHELHQRVKVAAAFEHERGESVPEHVGRDLEPDGQFEPPENLADGISGHRHVAPRADEEVRAFHPIAGPRAEVLAQDRGKPGRHRHDAVLLSLSLDDADHHAAHVPEAVARGIAEVAQIDVGQTKARDLGSAQASEEHQRH